MCNLTFIFKLFWCHGQSFITQTMFQPQGILIITLVFAHYVSTSCKDPLSFLSLFHLIYHSRCGQDSLSLQEVFHNLYWVNIVLPRSLMVTLQQKSLKAPKGILSFIPLTIKLFKCLSHGTGTGFCPWNVNRRYASNFLGHILRGELLDVYFVCFLPAHWNLKAVMLENDRQKDK